MTRFPAMVLAAAVTAPMTMAAGPPNQEIVVCEVPRQEGTARPVLPDCPGPVCFPPSQIFQYEDTDSVMLEPTQDNGAQVALMVEAANALIALHGDEFDFIGFYTAFEPAFRLGGAFYTGVRNNVSGIGMNHFDNHARLGLLGDRLQAMVMLYTTHQTGVNPETCEPGVTLMFHEIGHRWAVWLPDLADGRSLEGDGGACGTGLHWGFYVDCQWSSLQCLEWVGDHPLKNNGDFPNTDTGGWLSLLEVYLMGYISAGEMDALMSEQRYLDQGCKDPYNGTVSTFSSADIIAVAGERVPTVEFAQKDFKSAWVVLYQPGAPPTAAELDNLGLLVEKFTSDWSITTLGRGTMTGTLFPDCNCNGTPDQDDLDAGTSSDVDDNARPDECDSVIRLHVERSGLSWSALPGGLGYDVVRGDLSTLAISGGDFTLAMIDCLADDLATTAIDDPEVPPAGEGFWYLLRPELEGGAGTYDLAVPSQQGSRDAEIAASPLACS